MVKNVHICRRLVCWHACAPHFPVEFAALPSRQVNRIPLQHLGTMRLFFWANVHPSFVAFIELS